MGGWATWWNTGHWTSSSSKIERKLRPGNHRGNPTKTMVEWWPTSNDKAPYLGAITSALTVKLFCFAIGAFDLVFQAPVKWICTSSVESLLSMLNGNNWHAVSAWRLIEENKFWGAGRKKGTSIWCFGWLTQHKFKHVVTILSGFQFCLVLVSR